MLRQNEIDEIERAINMLNGDSEDISLFKTIFRIRNEAGVQQTVREIGDFINHNPKNKGTSYQLATKFANNIMDLMESGFPELDSNWLFITQSKFVNDLIESLNNQNKWDKTKINLLKKASFKILRMVIKALDGGTFTIDRTNLDKCELVSLEKDGYFILEIRIHLQKYSEPGTPALVSSGGKLHMSFFKPICSAFLNATPPSTPERKTGYIQQLA